MRMFLVFIKDPLELRWDFVPYGTFFSTCFTFKAMELFSGAFVQNEGGIGGAIYDYRRSQYLPGVEFFIAT